MKITITKTYPDELLLDILRAHPIYSTQELKNEIIRVLLEDRVDLLDNATWDIELSQEAQESLADHPWYCTCHKYVKDTCECEPPF